MGGRRSDADPEQRVRKERHRRRGRHAPHPQRADGRTGNGQVSATSFQVPADSIDFWIDRFAAADVDFQGPEERFGEQVITLADPDGLPLELIGRGAEAPRAAWEGSNVPAERSIRGFAGTTFSLDGYERTADLLTTTMGFTRGEQEGSRFRFHAGEGDAAVTIDLLCQPEGGKGRMGIGAVHHIALRAASGEEQLEWRRVLGEAGQDVTPVLDRNYFTSVYFREPGGVLFEIATDEPGFAADESPDALGEELKLPPWLEPRRERLEATLPELHIRPKSQW